MTMWFDPRGCPECGDALRGTAQRLTGCATIFRCPDGPSVNGGLVMGS